MKKKNTLIIIIVSFLLLINILFFIIIFFDIISATSLIGPYRISHWAVWGGAGFIAIYTPIYSYLKRKYPKKTLSLLNIHIFGNLTAFIFITIHFSTQLSRPAQFYPDLGTGITLYPIVLVLVVTGIMQKFRLPKTYQKQKRFLHVSIAVSFYIVIITHILQGLNYL